MKSEVFAIILKKYREGKASEQEINLLFAYYNLFEGQNDGLSNLNAEELNSLRDNIRQGIKKPATIKTLSKRARRPRIWQFAAAASILILLSAGIALLLYSNKKPYIEYKNNTVAIKAGYDQAVLTLSNGKQIFLNHAPSGNVAIQGASVVTKYNNGLIVYNAKHNKENSDTSHNIVSTPRGGQFEVVLADGSKVFLNAGSTLRFPVSFTNRADRVVNLTGEAYFEVTHNAQQPFKVISKNQTIEVLGTHFDVSAYNNDHLFTTTLLEGRIRLNNQYHQVILDPGMQARLNPELANDNIKLSADIEAEDAIAWKNGIFHFENADIKQVMRQFERWYNVDVTYDEHIEERLFSGEIHRDLDLQEALKLLNYVHVHFSIDGRKITISK